MFVWTISLLSISYLAFILGRCWEDLKTDMSKQDWISIAFIMTGILLIVVLGGLIDAV